MLQQAAASAAGQQQYPAATLYVVATPIGNLADITLRAVHVLSRMDAVACEDTRVSAGLLRHLGLHKPLLALHQHNEQQAAGSVCERLAAGQRVAYVSDAGTPAVSDPGAGLVAAVRARGFRVLPVPGASSVLCALSVAGDIHAHGVVMLGFLPTKGAQREAALVALAQDTRAQVVMEAPHRISAMVQSLALHVGARTVTLARELTKQFETVVSMPAQQLPSWISLDPQRERGEFVLVVHAQAPKARSAPGEEGSSGQEAVLDGPTHHLLQRLLQELPLKQAVALAADLCPTPRNELYAAALRLKAQADAAPG